jgi:hypothetical protein
MMWEAKFVIFTVVYEFVSVSAFIVLLLKVNGQRFFNGFDKPYMAPSMIESKPRAHQIVLDRLQFEEKNKFPELNYMWDIDQVYIKLKKLDSTGQLG